MTDEDIDREYAALIQHLANCQIPIDRCQTCKKVYSLPRKDDPRILWRKEWERQKRAKHGKQKRPSIRRGPLHPIRPGTHPASFRWPRR
jgi:hypothetical protein